MEGLTGDIETQALKTQREIYRQLGRLKQLRVLWLGHETRDFGNLDSHRVTLDERRLELGLPKKDPKRVFEVNEEEEEQEKDVALSEEENVGANEGTGSDSKEDDAGDSEGAGSDGEDEDGGRKRMKKTATTTTTTTTMTLTLTRTSTVPPDVSTYVPQPAVPVLLPPSINRFRIGSDVRAQETRRAECGANGVSD
jgi:hypothetical protein